MEGGGCCILGCFSEQVPESLGKSDLAEGLIKGSFSSSVSDYFYVSE